MKKVFSTIVIGLMTMIGFSQVVKVNVTKIQLFEHSNLISTPSAFENGTATYLNGGTCNASYTFDLNKMTMVLDFLDEKNKKITHQFKIIEKYNTTNLVDVLIINKDGEKSLFVLGNTVSDNSYVLITNKKIDDKITGFFFPDCEVKVLEK